MVRNITCKNCKEEFAIKSDSHSRHELEDERGRYFTTKCKQCHIDNEYHVNDVEAKNSSSKMIAYITLGITLFLMTTVYYSNMGLVGITALIIPAFVYLRLQQNSKKSLQLFNKGDISRIRPV